MRKIMQSSPPRPSPLKSSRNPHIHFALGKEVIGWRADQLNVLRKSHRVSGILTLSSPNAKWALGSPPSPAQEALF